MLNYDPTLSISKRAGRAVPTVKLIAAASKAQGLKHFDSIKGTVLELRGRTSEDTILVTIHR